MVKGISKQVIVVNSPDKKMFDQAIFILSDEAIKDEGITNDDLMREARSLIRKPAKTSGNSLLLGVVLALSGALITGAVWFLTTVL